MNRTVAADADAYRAADLASFVPHPVYGFMCPLLKPNLNTP